MTATTIRARLAQLEMTALRTSNLPPLRVIQNGDLTEEQGTLVADAEAEGRLVIIRQIVSPACSGAATA